MTLELRRGSPLPVPGIVGGCRLESVIGRGGMGVVFRAVQLGLQRPVAVKMLAEDCAFDEEAVRRFEAEARMLAQVNHPNIVQVYFAGREGRPYLVMEYVDGRDLADLLRVRGRLECAEAARIIAQAANGLQAAWNLRIVHGDVKPGNLLVTAEGMVKVADFGLARLAPGRDALEGGTPQYMSPEQCGGQPLDTRSDIYSLGLTFWHSLTGRAPFAGGDPLETGQRQAVESPPPVDTIVPEVPEEIAGLIARMIEKRPEDRPQTPADVAKELEAWLHSAGPARSPAGGAVILVVDDDAWIRESVSAVLNGQGFEVVAAADAASAMSLADRLCPDLMILDVLLPDASGWSLFKQLRAKPSFAFVPAIFLTALDTAPDRIRGFRLGADDFIGKPFVFTELVHRVTRALHGRVRIESEARRDHGARAGDVSGVTGTLDQIGLASLLSMLEAERKCGVITVTGGPGGDVGLVFLRDGRVVAARMERGPRLADAEAVFHLLGWTCGSFEFAALAVTVPDTVRATTPQLLLEAARRLDEGPESGLIAT